LYVDLFNLNHGKLADQGRPTAFEHIMIIYYDALMIDEESLLNTRHSRRFEILKDLVDCRKGWAELVQRRTIDFGGRLAASDLRNVFAKTITSRQEGLVLKPDEPYFDFMQGLRPMGARCIKLKKEYIGNFGDIGDFAAVGAGYDPVKAKSYKIPNLKWTHFYIGTLDNKEQVQRWKSKPLFTVIAIVELNETLLKSVVLHGSPMPLAREDNTSTELTIPIGVEKNPRMTVAFANPLVFDLRCFSFDKEGNTGFWSPRFPTVTKVHLDRDFADCLSFQELQELALENTTIPELPDSQENLEWIARLEAADPRGIAVDAMSEASLSTVPTPSPRCCNQNTENQSPIPASFIPTTSPEVVALKPNRAFAVPNGQLVTPPTSSAPEESTKLASLKNQEQCAHKRPLSTRIGHATPSKKRRPSTAHAPARSSFIDQPSAASTRKPLGDIDGNSSQLSASSSHIATNHGKQEVIDLTSSPENSFQEAVAGPLIESCEGEFSSQESELVTVFLPDSLRSFNDENDIPSSQLIAAESACQFVGKNCQFANTHIILSPCLVNPIGELAALFEEHGLTGVTMTINEWLGDHGNFRNIPQLDGVPKKTIVLVDCLEHATEMKTAMKVLEGHRSKDMPERQEWITAYDWRVLRYISILEDETKTKKYYDGFTSPWTRWFCGLV
jgi:DNA ligase-4